MSLKPNNSIENLVQFNLLSDNPFWGILRETNQAHITNRQRYESLVDLCKDKGVAFKDIEAHLFNEAKKCGLYRKTHYTKSSGHLDYPPKTVAFKTGWGNALNNFLKWLWLNYRDYDVPVSHPYVSKKPSAGAATTTKEVIVRREEKKKTPSSITPPAATQQQVQPLGIVSPVNQPLSTLQIQTVILQNLNVLGLIAKEHGPDAISAFNLLMIEMGCKEFCMDEEG